MMFFSALVLGVLGSFHCMGMCGPIVFMLPVDRNNAYRKAGQIAIYHFGRLLSYSVIGLVFGLIGKSLHLFGFQQQLSISIGVLMILLVILPKRVLRSIQVSKPIYRYISKIKSTLGTAIKKKTADTFLTIGFLNGFLPCGLVYMALFAAIASGNALNGSLYMVVFGLGTIPLMTTAIYFSHFLRHTARQRIQRAVPVFVILMGVLFIVRGLGLGIPYLSPAPVYELVSHGVGCH